MLHNAWAPLGLSLLADLVSIPLSTSVKRTANKAQPKTNRGVSAQFLLPLPFFPRFSPQVTGNYSSNTIFKQLLVYCIIKYTYFPIPQQCHKRLCQKLLKSRQHQRYCSPQSLYHHHLLLQIPRNWLKIVLQFSKHCSYTNSSGTPCASFKGRYRICPLQSSRTFLALHNF